MRLDKYLKISRIIKRRTVANEVCAAGKAEVNGRSVKPSYDIKIGDKVCIKVGSKNILFEVLSLNEYAKKEEAADMYKIISET